MRGGVFLAAALALCGCGPTFGSVDVKDATNAERGSLLIEEMICPEPQKTCDAEQVRAAERMALCANYNMLVRHNKPAPSTGDISCPPPQ